MEASVAIVTAYPKTRLKGLPPSPLAFVHNGFESLFTSPERVRAYHQLFSRGLIHTREMKATKLIQGKTYLDHMTLVHKNYLEALTTKRLLSLWRIARIDFAMMTDSGEQEINKLTGVPASEMSFLRTLTLYLGHDHAHAATRAIINAGKRDLINNIYPTKDGSLKGQIPEAVFGLLNNFYQQLDQYSEYADELIQMAIDFFTPLSKLPSSPAVTGKELPDFIAMFCHAFALRFLMAHFAVTDTLPEGELARNTIYYHVDPSLANMRLPKFLLGPKLVGNIKNGMRIVWQNELKKDNAGQPTSLKMAINNEPVPNPVLYKVEALPVTPRVWELRFSDNGKGILTSEMYKPLAIACETHPENISPALKIAVERWQHGDAFAFNQIPLEDMLEAVFQLGVSVGSGGSKGTGMGLWGSTMLLLKLGGQIKVGINPKTGGYFESVILPMDLSVPPEEVADVAQNYWANYIRP